MSKINDILTEVIDFKQLKSYNLIDLPKNIQDTIKQIQKTGWNYYTITSYGLDKPSTYRFYFYKTDMCNFSKENFKLFTSALLKNADFDGIMYSEDEDNQHISFLKREKE